jgi:hypothetical protein
LLVLSNPKLARALLIELGRVLIFVLVCSGSIQMVVYRIFDATKVESAIKDRPAVFFISLAKARVLMELSQYFVQCWYWMVALQILELLLNGFTCQLIILCLLEEVAVMT